MRLGWLVRAAFVFGGGEIFEKTGNIVATDLRGFTRIDEDQYFPSRVWELFVRDLFSRIFHSIVLTFTASSQVILRFAFYSLMLGERMRQSSVRQHGNH